MKIDLCCMRIVKRNSLVQWGRQPTDDLRNGCCYCVILQHIFASCNDGCVRFGRGQLVS